MSCKTHPVCEHYTRTEIPRKTCATRWLQSGATLRDIQLLLGHKSLATTQKYLGATVSAKLRPIIDLAFGDLTMNTAYPTIEEALARGCHIDDTSDDIDFSTPDGSAARPYPAESTKKTAHAAGNVCKLPLSTANRFRCYSFTLTQAISTFAMFVSGGFSPSGNNRHDFPSS